MPARALITVKCVDINQLDVHISPRRSLTPVTQELVSDFACDIAEQIPLTHRLKVDQYFQAHVQITPFFDYYETSDGSDCDAGVVVTKIRIFKRKLK
jgi:hypothetical protein